MTLDQVKPMTEITPRFRIRSKRLFLTFPQCSVARETALENIKNIWKDKLDWVVIAQEKHQDGNLHLHIGLQTTDIMSYSNAKFADGICSLHGNYQAMKSLKSCLKYILKADPSPIAHNVDPYQLIASTSSGTALDIVMACKDGSTLEKIDDLYPVYILRNKRKVEEYLTFQHLKKTKLNLVPLPPLEINHPVIHLWIQENLYAPRKFKQKQLYIHGPPNMGKTSLILALTKYLSIYYIPSEEFYDDYYDGMFKLTVLDEFKATKTIQWLNQWLQGSPMPIRKKGSQSIKTDNLPVIILSNYSIEECYSKASHDKIESLKARLEIVSVSEFITIKELNSV